MFFKWLVLALELRFLGVESTSWGVSAKWHSPFWKDTCEYNCPVVYYYKTKHTEYANINQFVENQKWKWEPQKLQKDVTVQPLP